MTSCPMSRLTTVSAALSMASGPPSWRLFWPSRAPLSASAISGNFPTSLAKTGGGAFVLIYLLCVFAIGLPIMMSETMLGRRGRRNPVASMTLLGEEEGNSPALGAGRSIRCAGRFHYSVVLQRHRRLGAVVCHQVGPAAPSLIPMPTTSARLSRRLPETGRHRPPGTRCL